MSDYKREHRLHFKYSLDILRDALLFSVLAVILGFLIDYLFPLPNKNESTLKTIFLIALQIVIGAITVYLVAEIYTYIFGYDPDRYFGFTMYTVVYFLVQIQLLYRLNMLYIKMTGKSFE